MGNRIMARNEVIQIRCSTVEKEKWKDTAASMGMELSAWMRLILDRATRENTIAGTQTTLTEPNT